MNKFFASLPAAVIVSLATSLAAAPASADVLASETATTFHRHVLTPRLVTPRVNVIGPVVVPVVRPRTLGGARVIRR